MKILRVIKSWFKKKNKAAFNLHHPDLLGVIEYSFTCSGVDYYTFSDSYKIPIGRYKYVASYFREMELCMDKNTLTQYIAELKKCLNAEKRKIDLEGAWRIILNMESRSKLAFEPSLVKKLASVVYFDKSEDLSTFSEKYGDQKIQSWDKSGTYDFFLTRPISELIGMKNISITSLEEYIQTTGEILKNLTTDMQNLSLENSLENGKKTS